MVLDPTESVVLIATFARDMTAVVADEEHFALILDWLQAVPVVVAILFASDNSERIPNRPGWCCC
jgi:hypothetical protein